MGDALWSFCHIAGLWPPLQNCFTVLHPCDFISLRHGQNGARTESDADRMGRSLTEVLYVSNLVDW